MKIICLMSKQEFDTNIELIKAFTDMDTISAESTLRSNLKEAHCGDDDVDVDLIVVE